MNYELAYKEELFFILSADMERDEAVKTVELVASNFKKCYSSQKTSPKIGEAPTYKLTYMKCHERGWDMWWVSSLEKYENGEWKEFMRTTKNHTNLLNIANRLIKEGNVVLGVNI